MMRARLLILLAVLAAAGCRNGATTPSPADVDQTMAVDQIMYDLQHTMTDDGIRRAILYGDTAFMHQGGGKIDIVGVRLTFFDENGRESGELTSETGTYEMRAASMVAEGNVVLRTQGEEGERVLETERLHFDVNGDRLWSDLPVVMREGGRELRGTSFESDGRFENVTVQRAETTGGPPTTGRGGITF